jgi:hypothetical protein
MHDLDSLMFFHLYGDYLMDDRERELSTVRYDTYELFRKEADSLRHLRDKVRNL